MQNNFEWIFKLIVALTFLMCVVCSHYQYSFLMFFCIILLFSFYVLFFFLFFFCFFLFFLFYFLERKTEKGSEKERNKANKES